MHTKKSSCVAMRGVSIKKKCFSAVVTTKGIRSREGYKEKTKEEMTEYQKKSDPRTIKPMYNPSVKIPDSPWSVKILSVHPTVNNNAPGTNTSLKACFLDSANTNTNRDPKKENLLIRKHFLSVDIKTAEKLDDGRSSMPVLTISGRVIVKIASSTAQVDLCVKEAEEFSMATVPPTPIGVCCSFVKSEINLEKHDRYLKEIRGTLTPLREPTLPSQPKPNTSDNGLARSFFDYIKPTKQDRTGDYLENLSANDNTSDNTPCSDRPRSRDGATLGGKKRHYRHHHHAGKAGNFTLRDTGGRYPIEKNGNEDITRNTHEDYPSTIESIQLAVGDRVWVIFFPDSDHLAWKRTQGFGGVPVIYPSLDGLLANVNMVKCCCTAHKLSQHTRLAGMKRLYATIDVCTLAIATGLIQPNEGMVSIVDSLYHKQAIRHGTDPVMEEIRQEWMEWKIERRRCMQPTGPVSRVLYLALDAYYLSLACVALLGTTLSLRTDTEKGSSSVHGPFLPEKPEYTGVKDTKDAKNSGRSCSLDEPYPDIGNTESHQNTNTGFEFVLDQDTRQDQGIYQSRVLDPIEFLADYEGLSCEMAAHILSTRHEDVITWFRGACGSGSKGQGNKRLVGRIIAQMVTSSARFGVPSYLEGAQKHSICLIIFIRVAEQGYLTIEGVPSLGFAACASPTDMLMTVSTVI